MINELAHSKTKVSVLSQKGPRQGGPFLSEAIAKFCKIQVENFVDFEKCCKMRIWMQNFVSIQPRTSRKKSDVSWLIRAMVSVSHPFILEGPRDAASALRVAAVAQQLGSSVTK